MQNPNFTKRLIQSNIPDQRIKPTVSQRTVSVKSVNRLLGQATTTNSNANVGRYVSTSYNSTDPVAFALDGSKSVIRT